MTVFAFFTFVIAAFIWTMQSDDHVTTIGRDRLKYALDIATHDAAQMVDKVQLGNGLIRFDAVAAQNTALHRLRQNLKLDATLRPLANNLFRSTDQLQVVYFDRVETGCPNKPAGFPCIYNVNLTVNTATGTQNFNYIDTIAGPSIISVIKMNSPRPYGISKPYTYIVGSSHEYKPY